MGLTFAQRVAKKLKTILKEIEELIRAEIGEEGKREGERIGGLCFPKPHGGGRGGVYPPGSQPDPLGRLDINPLEFGKQGSCLSWAYKVERQGTVLQASLGQESEGAALGVSCPLRACGPILAPGRHSWS